MEKKYSGSQKTVGPASSFSQQVIQRHNFLLPREEASEVLPSYRGVENQKSKSPMPVETHKLNSSSNRYENRGGFSTEKRMVGLGQ